MPCHARHTLATPIAEELFTDQGLPAASLRALSNHGPGNAPAETQPRSGLEGYGTFLEGDPFPISNPCAYCHERIEKQKEMPLITTLWLCCALHARVGEQVAEQFTLDAVHWSSV